jgi:hypothetical protein
MRVKVWNDNVHPYTEIFKGDKIYIEAKSFIEMEEDEALQFQGKFSPPIYDGDKNHMPQGFKMIRIDRGGAPIVPAKPTSFACNACKEVFQTEKSLALHSEHAHKDEAFVDETAEAEITAKKRGRPAKAG